MKPDHLFCLLLGTTRYSEVYSIVKTLTTIRTWIFRKTFGVFMEKKENMGASWVCFSLVDSDDQSKKIKVTQDVVILVAS